MDIRRILVTMVGPAACTFALAGTAPSLSAAPPQRANASPAIPDMQTLFNQLDALSQRIVEDTQAQQLCQHQLEQAQILFQLVTLVKDEERNGYLKTAVDSVYNAAIQSPEKQSVARQWLASLPEQLSHAFPGNPIVSYAARQQIQADYEHEIGEAGDDAKSKAQEHLCQRLMQLAQAMPGTPEAPKAVMDAAQLRETLKMPAEAQQCYAYFVEHFTDSAQVRKAAVSLHRLGLKGERIQLQLPLLFCPNDGQVHGFDLQELRGKVVVVFFWSSTSPQAASDLQALRTITEAYRDRGLEVVYVNTDADAATSRQFLADQRTAGEHVHLKGGLEDRVAERCGIDSVPQAILIGKDGTVLGNSLQASQLEKEIEPLLPRARQHAR